MTNSRQDGSEHSNFDSPKFDVDGVPWRNPVTEWIDLASPRPSQWLQAILRFTRSNGSSVFEPNARSSDRFRRLEAFAQEIGDPSLISVLAGWNRSVGTFTQSQTSLPVAYDSRPDRPLAVLRSDWAPSGDLLAIDHRQPGPESLIEIASRGQVWIGPTWTSTRLDGKFSRPKPKWSATPFAHSLEWTFKAGPTRVTRQVTVLRGRSIAIVAELVEGANPESEIRLRLGDPIEAKQVEDSRAIQLSSGPGKAKARLIPLGLPSHDRPTESGSIDVDGREIVIRQKFVGIRGWLPVVISWGTPVRTWRGLTVASRSRLVTGDQAVAFRIGWGPRESGLVIYRSLGPRNLRSFLGHQTSSRFLVGSLSRTGEITPILKVDH